ncbi:MAG: transketolase, partial [Phaeodactylibacter sp.]|nr:transketolase [Phaeodactylibacter sp.]
MEDPTIISIQGAYSKEEVHQDYYTCALSREVSRLIRKETLTGKAKFGVSDDGKELFQVALAKAFRKGDFRSDYYRGHTLLFALGLADAEHHFAQLYTDADNDPFSGGRQMNNHHATPIVDGEGQWLPTLDRYNLSSDISTTAGQMARGIGLAMASKKYRQCPELSDSPFSDNGNEVVFTNIGDASTSEGPFWEVMNAAAVQQVPMVVTVVDDGYGISVPRHLQTAKASISQALDGLQAEEDTNGIEIFHVNGWDYPALCAIYREAAARARKEHRPVLVHVDELTQPQGHSTSGSHERYKSKERLEWERSYDCNLQFRYWILANGLAEEEELQAMEARARKQARAARDRAWKTYNGPIRQVWKEMQEAFAQVAAQARRKERAEHLCRELEQLYNPVRADIVRCIRRMLFATRGEDNTARRKLEQFLASVNDTMQERYHTHLHSQTGMSALKVPVVAPSYSPDSPLKNGYEILNIFFDKMLGKYPNLFAFGEDVGQIGDVNQGFSGLQEKYGEARIFDTGIREWTIAGYAIGMAMRGLRPIAEIQYLDYLIYALSPLSDDLATLRYRTKGVQAAPAIIRTRGHRLEGIWHSGSPMSVLLGSLRGLYVLVPRNMVQAAGMYNTLLQSDDPALLIECLNGYRLKEKLPDNIGEYNIPFGMPEILQEG